ncbi:Carbon-nitrogen hydrolase [Klebsormidium nitens]|uniref:Carbon-nitrogen hydrolase n=1 Tax=Klebsormidium nitens TaxID=105231 RepID=A0A1Y1I0G3_KLENI|nr:Carbon-nitrogen hydrolase [Klebsormidium nitens]|eukprot:GAQ83943.1 Carbon-nitrogen hydrolase [Klebsormidium nitens]
MASPNDAARASVERKGSKVAVAQMRSTGDIEANFETVASLVKDAASASCSMLFLPESFSFIGTRGSEGIAIADQLDGPLMGRYRQLARDHSIWLSLGGFQETSTEPNRLHNTHVIVNDSGDIAAVYRKIHLFDVDVPNGPKLLESASTAPGSELVVTDSPAGRLGVTTCYDLRFPQMYQQLRFRHGAEILLVPSAFTKTTGEAHWEVLLRARAIECQCYVIAAAQAGRHNEKRESFGDALIIDPWGRIVARLEDPLAVGIATAEIDLAALQSVRTSMPVAQHRRYDIYGDSGASDGRGVRSTL